MLPVYAVRFSGKQSTHHSGSHLQAREVDKANAARLNQADIYWLSDACKVLAQLDVHAGVVIVTLNSRKVKVN